MKGIRKLFLGLIFLTLFGVGFKVEAKAAVTLTPSEPSDGKWSSDALLRLTYSFDTRTDYPTDIGAQDVYTCIIYTTDMDHPLDTHTVVLACEDLGGGKSRNAVYIDGTDKTGKSSYTFDTTIDRDDIYNELPTTGTGETKEVKLYAKYSKNGGEFTGSEYVKIEAGRLDISAYYLAGEKGKFPSGASAVVFDPASGAEYLLKGDTQLIKVTSGPGKGYELVDWTQDQEIISAVSTCTAVGTGALTTVLANYDTDASAFSVTKLKNNNYKIILGETSSPLAYTVKGYNLNTEVSSVQINGVDVPHDFDTENSKFQFKAVGKAGPNNTLKISMKDGASFEYKINMIDPSKIKFSIPSTIKVSVGKTKDIVPSYEGATPTAVDYQYPDADSTYFTHATLTDTTDRLTGVKESTKTYTVNAVPVYGDIDGADTLELASTGKITVGTAAAIELKDIFVNKKKTVNLSDFLKSGDEDEDVTVSKYTSYITVSPKTGAVKKIEITGESSSKDKVEKGLTLDTGETADVTVYPDPTLSLDTTGSGSSYKQTYTVKMPKGVYHDEKSNWIESVSKAKLVFKASSNSDKTREVTVDSFTDLTGDDKLLKKATKELKWSDLNVIFRDLCKNDSDTISVIAYPYNTSKDKIDDKIATEKKEFTVYKIGLDTSGGATYTVNGETVSDYFYGIDGVTYDIKASGKTANAKLDKTTSSSEFGSGESIQYKVAGARTLKAVYSTGSNSNEGSSGNMDDYDDVPKTGESKADIWILWTVLFIAILGAGFMIWKRFGLVRAIAAADAEVAIAEEEERIETEKKEKEDKLNMLKDLRNL